MKVYVSRTDRIGDLVLSLPVLGYLGAASLAPRALHVSEYARDIGDWALANGLCEELIVGSEAPREAPPSTAVGLALFHTPETVALFRRLGLRRTFGPRTKLSTLWSYSRTRAQHRSRVERSEAAYNLELAKWMLENLDVRRPDFAGLPALKVPVDWRAPRVSPDVLVVATNRGSAGDWPFESYLDWIRRFLGRGARVDVLLNGVDADRRRAAFEASDLPAEGAGLVTQFSRLRELIAYIAGTRLVVSSSTGPLHLAHAAGVPVVGIYPTAPLVETFDRWRPDGYRHAAPVRLIEIARESSWSPETLWP